MLIKIRYPKLSTLHSSAYVYTTHRFSTYLLIDRLINKLKFHFCRCAKDNALRYNYTLSPVQRLILSAFRFNAVKSKEIFLHCLVKACLRSDQSSRCAEGCPFSKRKKRESENEIERFLALGPIIVSSNEPSKITGMASMMSLAIKCERFLFCSKICGEECKPT